MVSKMVLVRCFSRAAHSPDRVFLLFFCVASDALQAVRPPGAFGAGGVEVRRWAQQPGKRPGLMARLGQTNGVEQYSVRPPNDQGSLSFFRGTYHLCFLPNPHMHQGGPWFSVFPCKKKKKNKRVNPPWAVFGFSRGTPKAFGRVLGAENDLRAKGAFCSFGCSGRFCSELGSNSPGSPSRGQNFPQVLPCGCGCQNQWDPFLGWVHHSF